MELSLITGMNVKTLSPSAHSMQATKADYNKPQLSLLSGIWLKRVVVALEKIKQQVLYSEFTCLNISSYAYNKLFEHLLDWNNANQPEYNTNHINNNNCIDNTETKTQIDHLALASGWLMIMCMNLSSISELVRFFERGSEYQLLFDKWLILVTKVLMFGKIKYSAHNWRLGFNFTRVYDATSRHLIAYNSGELLDPESGLSHLGHASCGLMFSSELEATHAELDDRYKQKLH